MEYSSNIDLFLFNFWQASSGWSYLVFRFSICQSTWPLNCMGHIGIQATSLKPLSLGFRAGEIILSPCYGGRKQQWDSKQTCLQSNLLSDHHLLKLGRGPWVETLIFYFEMWNFIWNEIPLFPEPSTKGETEIVYFNITGWMIPLLMAKSIHSKDKKICYITKKKMKHCVIKYCLFYSSEYRFVSHSDSNFVRFLCIFLA